jgi:hypothetical protein
VVLEQKRAISHGADLGDVDHWAHHCHTRGLPEARQPNSAPDSLTWKLGVKTENSFFYPDGILLFGHIDVSVSGQGKKGL